MIDRKDTTVIKKNKLQWITLAVAFAALLTLGACKKKVAPPPPPPPPPAAAPTASLVARPETIQRGHSSALAWTTTNATDISIEGIGSVDATGSRTVSPTESTTYRLVAKGPGGTQEAAARITVTEPPPLPPPPSPTEEELFQKNIKNIFFDFDKYNNRPDQEGLRSACARYSCRRLCPS